MMMLNQWERVINALKEESYRSPAYSDNKIYISQSLISNLFFRNEEKEYCPNYIYETAIKGTPTTPNEYMIRGLYFEERVIGTSGNKSYSLPKKLNGGITVTETRIQNQIDAFPLVCERHNIIVLPDKSNCQVEKIAHFDTIDGVDVFLKGKADMISNIKYGDSEEVAVIDLKLTGSLYGGYWSKPETIDPIQSIAYSVLFELPFYYYIFEYASALQYKIFNTATEYSKDKSLHKEGRTRRAELYEKLRLSAIIILNLLESPPKEEDKVPNKSNCGICPLSSLNGGNCNKHQKNNVI